MPYPITGQRTLGNRLFGDEQNVCPYGDHFRVQKLCCILLFPIPAARSLGSLLRVVNEGRHALHPLRLLRDLPVSAEDFETNPSLESAGRAYYEFRADLMVRNNEGLTKTYNRFHDPDERSPDILKLRELHAAMDRAVLDAYGWTDLKPTCEFLLDYEEDEDDDESGGGRRRKKPWRYRWPDDFRDEVLARLLELNRQRAEEERLSGAAAEGGHGKAKRKASRSKKAAAEESARSVGVTGIVTRS